MRSLRQQFVRITAVYMSIALGVAVSLAYMSSIEGQRNEFQADTQATTKSIRDILRPLLAAADFVGVTEAATALNGLSNVDGITVWTTRDITIFDKNGNDTEAKSVEFTVQDGGADVGRVRVTFTNAAHKRKWQTYFVIFSFILIFFVLMQMTFYYLFVRNKIIKPITRITGDIFRAQSSQSDNINISTNSRVSEINLLAKAFTAAYRRISAIASTDSLSKLGNRYGFERWLDRSEKGQALLIALIDIDHFKYINDHYGHHAGDMVIAELGQRLSGIIGQDAVAFRLGGDEFALVWLRKDQSIAEISARIEGSAQEGFGIGAGTSLFITISTGIAMFPADISDPYDVMRQADIALYASKRHGRNQTTVFSSGLQTEISQIATSSRVMRRMVEDGLPLPFLYQPIVDLPTGEVFGFESLLNVTDDQGIRLPPPVFVHACEMMGFAPQLNIKTCEDACRFLREQAPEGTIVTINLTSTQLMVANAAEAIERCIERSGCVTKQIVIEVNEAQNIEDPQVIEVLHDFLSRGMKIAIDDFGSGYSSLRSLHALPVHYVKLDKAFIRERKSSVRLLAALRTICASLDLRVIVEGIETAEDYQLSEALGFEYGQGYFMGRPSPDPMASPPPSPPPRIRPEELARHLRNAA